MAKQLSLFPAPVIKNLSRWGTRAKPKLLICPACGQIYRRMRGDTAGCPGFCAFVGRFWRYVQKTATCWYWTGGKTLGYGRMVNARTGESWMAHRFSYELHIGPIPAHLVLDHLCNTPSCVNPSHLQAVTPRENTMRGRGPAAKNAKKTHCKNGHLFDEANTIVKKTGYRQCRQCKTRDNQTRSAARRAQRE